MASIDAISRLGHRNATKLRKAGIRTTEALLNRAATRKGRRALAEQTGFTEQQLLTWVNRGDLLRVKGVGQEYADLLEAAGADTVRALRNRSPANLLKRMVEQNKKARLVRRLPTPAMVERWVAHARELPPVVSN